MAACSFGTGRHRETNGGGYLGRADGAVGAKGKIKRNTERGETVESLLENGRRLGGGRLEEGG